MEFLALLVDIVLHLDKHLQALVTDYGVWIYCETGLVVTPFLPGDSLLFVAGTLAATGGMDIHILFLVLAAASFLGDNTNYWIGRFIGPRAFSRADSKLLNPGHIAKTQAFYEKHGGKTIVIARFIPIVRTFAPFVAGIGKMLYPRFMTFSAAGSIFWIGSLTYAGYFFGNIPVVRKNLSIVIIAIVLISVLPGIVEYLRARRAKSAGTPPA